MCSWILHTLDSVGYIRNYIHLDSNNMATFTTLLGFRSLNIYFILIKDRMIHIPKGLTWCCNIFASSFQKLLPHHRPWFQKISYFIFHLIFDKITASLSFLRQNIFKNEMESIHLLSYLNSPQRISLPLSGLDRAPLTKFLQYHCFQFQTGVRLVIRSPNSSF